MKFRCFDYEIPKVALDCGFEDLSDDVDPYPFMVNKTLRLGLIVNGDPKGVEGSMELYTVVIIDDACQMHWYDVETGKGDLPLLETDDEDQLRRFVSVSAFAHNGAENAMDSGIEPTPDAEMTWDFLTVNCEDEDWPKDIPRFINATRDGYSMPYFYKPEFERHLKRIKGNDPNA